MRAGGRSFGLCASLAITFAASARAATYLPISDAELAARSPVIVRAQVLDVAVGLESLDGSDHPFTYVTLQVLEAIKGPMSGPTIRLRLPGGKVGNLAWWIPGTPEFAAGQEVIVLARPADGRPGVYHLSEFGLGRFDILQDESGRRLAVRPAFDQDEDLFLSKRTSAVTERAQGSPTPLRDAQSFLSALRAEAAGAVMLAVQYAAPTGKLSALPVLVVRPEWVNLGGAEPGNCQGQPCLFRWFWDTGASPNAVVKVSGTQTDLDDGTDGTPHVQNGINQWHSGIPATDVRVSGISGSGNITVFLDATTDFYGGTYWTTALPCPPNGIIGLGGPGSSSGAPSFKGDSPYYAPSGGSVSMRKVDPAGSACTYDHRVFRTAAMHELGHVLGLGHPDQGASTHSTTTSAQWNAAVMHSVVPAGTPDTPQADDIQGMQFYYGTGSGSPPTAAFTFSPLSPVTNQTINFHDTSTGSPTSWSWDFGDGQFSTTQHPSHSYSSPNTYTVKLTASNAAGQSVTPAQHSVVVTSPVPPTASFTFSPPSPVVGQTVFFTDTSSGAPTSWSWSFGDGSPGSSAQSPTHAYAGPGTFTVMLTVQNGQGSNSTSHSVVVSPGGSAPVAAFTFSPPTPQPNQAVTFTDTSTGGPTSWTWNFGDGFSSSLENPTHSYTAAGNYSVSLTAQNSSGASLVSQSVVVASGSSPLAAFTFSPPAPQPGQGLAFTDTSTGGPTSWSWDFGDGDGSAFQSPSHTFASAGTYTVRLTVSNLSGSNQTSQSIAVKIPTPCQTDSGTLPANAGDNFCITLAALDQRTGHAGPGLAIPQNVHFGYFSIPSITDDPDNPEVFVKVLDGRAVNGHFWVFYGGLTDLQYTITVRDFQTGLTRQYTKPFGSASGGFDVLAFAGASTPDVEKAPTPPAAPSTQSGCSNDSATLCLDSARGFTVTLAAVDQRTGHTGPGQAIPQSDVFGYFSIPALTSDPTNPEVFVKVLDGRAVNGHFWVFYGGLTDLQYTITVRDTATGQVRTYFKAGGSADGGFDVLAF